jgi:hypothetical protein
MPFACGPLKLQGDRGRQVAFLWNPSGDQLGDGYTVKMELTLAPDRTAMAGTVWTSFGSLKGEGQDIALVRDATQPLPPATECSGGEPSGECFLRPLRSDRVDAPRVLELGGGNLLLLWMNAREFGSRVASARFDAATRTWAKAEFLDDGKDFVDSATVAASPRGWAMVVYRQGQALLARSYDPEVEAWSEQRVTVTHDASNIPSVEALFVYDGGDATLIGSSIEPTGSARLSAYDYTAKAQSWAEPHLVDASPENAHQWAAASDDARNALIVWVRGTLIGEPDHLWFSSRSTGGTWTLPARLHTSEAQLLRPSMAIGKDGRAIVTWQEFLSRVASSSYTFETGAWDEPLTILSGEDIDNRALTINEAGVAVAYFHRTSALFSEADQKSELRDGVWGAPQIVSAEQASGSAYWVAWSQTTLDITPLYPRAGRSAPPALARPRCEGY